jgi:replicative DNA helicase
MSGTDYRALADAMPPDQEPAAGVPAGPPFDALAGEYLQALIRAKRAPVDAVPTMLPRWNRVCRDEGGGIGLARGWHVIVGAASGRGKSLLALNLIASAIRHGELVAYFSLEMSQAQVMTRLLAIATGTAVRRLENGADYDEKAAFQAAAEIDGIYERTGGLVYVNRRPLHRLSDIADAFRAEHEKHGCRVMVTDYLQLAWSGSAGTLFENTQEVSYTVRRSAVELGVVSIALSQLNRETSANRGQSPTIHGLMGGSVLENDADQVLLLDHATYERRGTSDAAVTLRLAKNRHGPPVEIPVRWDYRTLQVREESMDTEDPEAATRAALREGA